MTIDVATLVFLVSFRGMTDYRILHNDRKHLSDMACIIQIVTDNDVNI